MITSSQIKNFFGYFNIFNSTLLITFIVSILDLVISPTEAALISAVLLLHTLFNICINQKKNELAQLTHKIQSEITNLKTEVSKLNIIVGVGIQQANNMEKNALNIKTFDA